MAKEGKSLFSKAVIISVIIFFLNLAYLFYKNMNLEYFRGGFTGNSIKSAVSRVFDLSISSKIFLGVQFVFIIIILSYTFFYGYKARIPDEKIDSFATKVGPHQTDLDVLYEILKRKKRIRVSEILKYFKIKKETAMEWCKILESGELATIDYPGFGESVIQIKQSKNESMDKSLSEESKDKINKR